MTNPVEREQANLIAALDTMISRYLRALRSAITEAEGTDRLTLQQVRCLQAIAIEGEAGATTSQLADVTGVTVPTMSSMIDGLVVRSLVVRQSDQDNRRRVLLFITPQGLDILDRYQKILDARHTAIVGPMSDTSKMRLAESVNDVMTQLDRLGGISSL